MVRRRQRRKGANEKADGTNGEKEMEKSSSVNVPSGTVCSVLCLSYEKELESEESGDEKK